MATADNKKPALRTGIIRGAFLKLYSPRNEDPNKKATYEMTGITEPLASMNPKGKAALKAIQQACKDALRAEFGDAAFDANGKPAEGYDWPFKDAGTKSQYDGFEKGRVCFAMNTVLKVGIADATNGRNSDGEFPEAEQDDIYAGAYYIATVEAYAYKPKPGKPRKGVKLTLRSVIKVADGQRLDGRQAVGAEFADLSDDDFAFEDAGKVETGSKPASKAAAAADDEIDL